MHLDLKCAKLFSAFVLQVALTHATAQKMATKKELCDQMSKQGGESSDGSFRHSHFSHFSKALRCDATPNLLEGAGQSLRQKKKKQRTAVL